MLWLSRNISSIFAVLVAISFGGCAMRVGDFTVGSTKNISQLSQKGEKISGEDCSTNLFFLIPIQGPIVPNVKTAVDKALERAKGDVVADAVVWESHLMTVVYNQACYRVEGQVAKSELGKKK